MPTARYANRSSEVQEFRSSEVQKFRSSGVQKYAYGTLREQEYAYGTLREEEFRIHSFVSLLTLLFFLLTIK
jgi:hypothetical protein